MVPAIMMQFVATYIFYERHWKSVNRHMIAALTSEIDYVVEQLEHRTEKEQMIFLEEIKKSDIFNNISFDDGRNLGKKEFFLPDFQDALSKKIANSFEILYHAQNDNLFIKIKIDDRILLIETSEKRVASPTTYIFVMWLFGSSIILMVISIIFMKNQIRPINRLIEAVDKFGRGLEIEDFRPSGALEIRKAALAFFRMKKRVERQVIQRTQMLNAISHDLRTPLTRMRLEIAMIADDDFAAEMKKDVEEMEKMIESYLIFARGEGKEKTKDVNLAALLREVISNFENYDKNLIAKISEKLDIKIRENAIKRAITNIVDNAIKHTRIDVIIEMIYDEEYITITIKDDGIGIDESEFEQVFQPFYRIDNSRNSATGGSGLGLAISKDIIISHGGEIFLRNDSGLLVTLILPR